MTTKKTLKTDEVIELERAVMSVLWKHPDVATYELFLSLFTEHLAKDCAFDEFQIELAVRTLERGELQFPDKTLFTPPTTATAKATSA